MNCLTLKLIDMKPNYSKLLKFVITILSFLVDFIKDNDSIDNVENDK